MSDDVKASGFKSSEVISGMQSTFSQLSEAERKDKLKKTNAVFELQVTNEKKETVTWTIDMKKTGTVHKGSAKPKADVTLILSDETLVDLASGKLNGQKAYMTGKLKTKGNLMLATKLDSLISVCVMKKAKL
ncbi:SCP2 sterol-binding domain-containing protein [Amanita rubescens]|nr:SCP2 sterol-binding domain-containing protein [Amanita rubescens]